MSVSLILGLQNNHSSANLKVFIFDMINGELKIKITFQNGKKIL